MTEGPMVCTNCGAPMRSRSCKVRCPRCGYFEDCSDTALPGYQAPGDTHGPGADRPETRPAPQRLPE